MKGRLIPPGVLAVIVLVTAFLPVMSVENPQVRIQRLFLQNVGRNVEQNAYRRRLLEGILERVVAGEDMAALAREHSNAREPKARKGQPVDVDFFSLDPATRDVIRDMAPGQVSPIIETATGIQIIRLVTMPQRNALLPRPTPTLTPTINPGPIPAKAGVVGDATLPLRVHFGEVTWDEHLNFVQLSPLRMIPADPSIPFVRGPHYLYSTVKPATFYIPLEPLWGSEIIGFALWHRDTDPESSIVASLYAVLKEPYNMHTDSLAPPRLIGRATSDMAGMPHIHQPMGCLSERVQSDRYQYFMEIVLNSGDKRQMVFGGHVAFTFDGPGGSRMRAIRYAWTVTHGWEPAKMPPWAVPTLFPEGTPTMTPTRTSTPVPTVTPTPEP